MEQIICKNKKQRNSSFELLRIISMVMIVFYHFGAHGGFSFDSQVISIPRLWIYFTEMGGNVGVDIFVLISGYFLIDEKNIIFNIKKILKLWGEVFFYSISIYFVFCITKLSNFNFMSILESFFPFTFESWWFASSYFVLYIIHPFLNLFLNKIDQITYKKLLIIEFLLWIFIPTFTTSPFESNNLIWFITLYSISGYIKIYGLKWNINRNNYLKLCFISFVFKYLSCIILSLIGTRSAFAYEHIFYFYGQQSILTFLSAFTLFMFFEKTNFGYKKWINKIASAAFGVYLIHDNTLIRSYLWLKIFKNFSYQNSIILIPYSISVVCLVYLICTFIDLIRQNTVEKIYNSLINNYAPAVTKLINKIYLFISNLI